MTDQSRAERLAEIRGRLTLPYVMMSDIETMRWLLSELEATDDGLAICGGYLKTADAENARLRAALAAAAESRATPEGWKLVPVRPSPAMMQQGLEWSENGSLPHRWRASCVANVWDAMLSAAPQPPQPADAGNEQG